MQNKDIVEKNAKLVLDAYMYAFDHKLDIANKNDVLEILKAIDPEHATEKFVEVFMPMLEILNRMTEAEVARIKEENKVN